jgi:plastocyanin
LVKKITSACVVLLLGVIALLAGACGGDDGAAAARGPAPAGDVTIVAKNTAWDQSRIQLEAGRDEVIVVDNQDKGVQHNIHFTSVPDRLATKLEKGPVYQTLKVHFDQPGSYPYICDLHPTMKGTAVVS